MECFHDRQPLQAGSKLFCILLPIQLDPPCRSFERRQFLLDWSAVIDVLYWYATNVYLSSVKAVFVELPPFQRLRADYLDDAAYNALQSELMKNPLAGDVMEGTGGLRKLRQHDPRRGKGKRGGLRVIYYWWLGGEQFCCLRFMTKIKRTTWQLHSKNIATIT